MSYVKIIKNTTKQISKKLELSVKVCNYHYFAVPHNCIIIKTSSLSGFNIETLLDAFNTLNIPFFAVKLKGDLALVDLEDISIFERKPQLLDLKIRSSRLKLHPFVYNYQALGIGELEFENRNLISDYNLREFNNGIYKEFDLNINLALTEFRTQKYYDAWAFVTDSFAIPRNIVFKGVFVSHSQDDDAITVSRLTLLSQISIKISKLVNKELEVRASHVIYSMKDLLDLFWTNLRGIAPSEIHSKLKRISNIDDKLKKIDETLTKLQN